MNKQDQAGGLWEGAEVISVYTRAQALEDGVLINVSDWAREAGFGVPVAVTRGVWGILEPSKELEAEGEDAVGRAWDMFSVLLQAIHKTPGADAVWFAPRFTLEAGRGAEPVELWCRVGPGDAGETVLTIMRRGED